MSTAILFPGQGEQRPGMLHDLPGHPAVGRTLDAISSALGSDIRAMDTAEALASNAATQLALFAAATASFAVLSDLGVRPGYVAGHSIGAFAAAVACEALSLADAAQAVHVRGTAMENACPPGYGMGVVLGLTEPAVRAIAAECATTAEPLYATNVNAPRQITLSGATRALDRALTLAMKHGATKARHLPIPVPAHCPLMAEAERALAAFMDQVTISRPAVPFAGNIGGRTLRTAAAVRDDLIGSVTRPVRWHEATSVLYERGARLFIQVSPGDTLARLAATAFPEARVVSAQTTAPEHVRDVFLRTASQPGSLPS